MTTISDKIQISREASENNKLCDCVEIFIKMSY